MELPVETQLVTIQDVIAMVGELYVANKIMERENKKLIEKIQALESRLRELLQNTPS